MAKSENEIAVDITGNVSSLTTALNLASAKLGGFASSIKGLAIGGAILLGAKEVINFFDDSIKAAQRTEDAVQHLTGQIGPTFTSNLESVAGSFEAIGATSGDILTLDAKFSDIGTALGLTDPQIANMATHLADVATRMGLVREKDPSDILTTIGRAAGGSAPAARDLGVALDKQLTPAQQLQSILGQLSMIYGDAGPKVDSLQGNQILLNARIREFEEKVGPPAADVLSAIVGFINDELDAIPGAIEGWLALGKVIDGFARTALGPLGNVRDVLQSILDLLGQATAAAPNFGGESQTMQDIRNHNARNGLGAP